MNGVKKYTLIFCVALVSMGRFSWASGANEDTASGKKDEFNISTMIFHHIGDSHEWHFGEVGHTHLTIPLPVILYSKERGLDIFMSSKFNNLHEGEYNGYYVAHDKIYGEKPTLDEHGHWAVANPDPNKKVYDFSITKNVASLMLAAVLLIVIFVKIGASYRKNAMRAPRGIQSFFEPIVIFIRDDVAKNIIGEKKHLTYLPYLLTVFFFIWFNNMLGLFPGGANVTGNIAITASLGVITFLITNLSGNGHYWKHILWTPGVPLPLRIIILPIEIVGIFTKPFSLTVRLFANITAGHIIILSFIGLIFIFKSLLISPVSIAFSLFMGCMELFVAILQAYIFTLLSAMYIGSAVEDHGHDDHDHGH